jgi:hypothetical protein
MNTRASIEEQSGDPYVSTGQLPPPGEVVRLVNEAYARCKLNLDGTNSQVARTLVKRI